MGAVKRSVVIAVLAMAVGVTSEGAFVAEPRVAFAAPPGVEEPNRAAEEAAEPVPVDGDAPADSSPEPSAEPSPEVLADPVFTADTPLSSSLIDLSEPAPVGDLSGPVAPETEFDRALAEARGSGQPVELASETTETTISRVHPDGMVHVESGAGPMRTQVDGEWVDVDTTLELTEAGVRPVAVTGEIAFSAGGEVPMAVLGDGEGTEVSLAWPSELPEPELAGATATYREVLPDVDLVLTATRTGFEQHLVVNSRPDRATLAALRELEFPLATEGASVEEGDGGQLQVIDTDGEVIGGAGAPLMWDARTDPASGEPVKVDEIGLELAEPTAAGADATLVLTPPQEFLTDPTTVYPVTIDPTQALGLIGATFVQNNIANTPQAGQPELRVGTYNGGAQKNRSLLQFDVSQVENRVLQSATLSLFEFHSSSCSPRWVDIRNAGDFDPYTVTWNTQPWIDWSPQGILANANVAFGYNSTCPANWVNFNLTGWLAPWSDARNNRNPWMNLAVTAGSETDSAAWKKFNSASAGGNIPVLTFTYDGNCDQFSGLYVCGAVKDKEGYSRG
ncbi:hypothetical protein DQ238_22145 [Geodermatophilus sp. TF02-6]|uniref:DNRLRE domain-containing protein n=1 Tax=Geodermatophilus sp. TF02-6 TaxID=2250575 RepID=UPI000DE90B22|nr:DNRLRE domain-containing protein [Geodermatophilus sp. TF02-6]RBY74372.1 hypothetical protein DQ238_22145 [Geodermatophilus sp. TF02-6]